MLPTKKEVMDKRMELIQDYELEFDKYTNKGVLHISDLHSVVDDCMKWYAEKVIKHCAKVAEVDRRDYSALLVNKQSILNVIDEL